MVALHNKRLTDSDLFRGVLWNDKDWHAKRDEMEAQARAEGVDELGLIFRVGRLMEEYQQAQPSMKERQQIRKRLFPPAPAVPSYELTDEERDYIAMKLAGANDPLAESILKKLAKAP